MTINITLVGVDEFRARVEQIKAGVNPTINRALDKIGADLELHIKQNKLAGQVLRRRSGELAKVTHRREGLTEIVGNNTPYNALQEFGKQKLKPVNKKWLTIPLPAALNPSGQLKASALGWRNTFFQYSKRGNLILFQNQGKGNDPLPLFVLKKSVDIPARPYMRPALAEQKQKIIDEMNAAIVWAMRP